MSVIGFFWGGGGGGLHKETRFIPSIYSGTVRVGWLKEDFLNGKTVFTMKNYETVPTIHSACVPNPDAMILLLDTW